MIISKRITKITKLEGLVECYDIWNKDPNCYLEEGNFIASNIIVHNCIPDYIERRNDPHKVWKITENQLVAEILKDTHGIIVYQEQLTNLWQIIAGFTGPEAQEARKAVAKKWKEKLKPVREKWMQGATPVLGEERAKSLQANMESFGRYAFNVSHAIAYVLKAYACLYMAAHYGPDWWATVLSLCHPDNLDRFMAAAKASGVKFDTFSINNLSIRFVVQDGSITPGLISLKGVGQSDAETFAKKDDDPEFNHIGSFLKIRDKNKIVFERLIKLGAFKKYHPNIKATWMWYQYHYCSGVTQLKAEVHALIIGKDWTPETIAAEVARQTAEYQALYPKRKKIPPKIANWKPAMDTSIETFMELDIDDYTIEEMLGFEKQYLGYYWNSPLSMYHCELNATIDDAKECGEMECVIMNIEKAQTKTGSDFYRMTVTDGTSNALILLWDSDIRRHEDDMLKVGVGIHAHVCYDETRSTFTLERGSVIQRLYTIAEYERHTAN